MQCPPLAHLPCPLVLRPPPRGSCPCPSTADVGGWTVLTSGASRALWGLSSTPRPPGQAQQCDNRRHPQSWPGASRGSCPRRESLPCWTFPGNPSTPSGAFPPPCVLPGDPAPGRQQRGQLHGGPVSRRSRRASGIRGDGSDDALTCLDSQSKFCSYINPLRTPSVGRPASSQPVLQERRPGVSLEQTRIFWNAPEALCATLRNRRDWDPPLHPPLLTLLLSLPALG